MGLFEAFQNLFDGSEAHQNAGLGLLGAGLGILANNRGMNAGLPALGMGGMQGLQTYAKALESTMKRKQMDLQSQLYGAEADYKKAETNRLNLLGGAVKDVLGGGQTAGATQATIGQNPYLPTQSAGMPSYASGILDFGQQQAAPSQAGTPAGAPQNPYMPSGAGMFSPGNFQKLAAIKMLGGPDLTEMFKFANSPQPLKPGYAYNPVTGQLSYLDDPASGFEYNPATKTVRPLTGYAETNARAKGMETDAVERAKAGYTFQNQSDIERAKGRYTFQSVVGPDGVTRNVPTTSLSEDYYGGQRNDPHLHGSVVQAESGGNPNAVSPKGATGLYGTMPGTLRDPGYGVQPARNGTQGEQARVGADYLDAMVSKYGQAQGLAAYNMGPGAFEKWRAGGAQWNRLPAETRDYVGKVLLDREMRAGATPQDMPQGMPQGGGQPRGFVTADPAATKFAEGQAASAVKYGEDLTARITEGAIQMHNIDAQLGLAKQFRMGAGANVGMKAAQMAQAIGLPQNIVDGLARGDLGAMRAFEKVTINQTMSALRQSLGNNRMNRTEFEQFASANPNIRDDPNALEKVATFYRNIYERDVREATARDAYLQGGGNPSRWPVVWARHLQASGEVSTAPVQGVVQGSKPAPADGAGWSIREKPAVAPVGGYGGMGYGSR